jgi:hypothetical protein
MSKAEICARSPLVRLAALPDGGHFSHQSDIPVSLLLTSQAASLCLLERDVSSMYLVVL